jgi:NtrC-family two-component system sensor histidine kinase KinB
VVLVAAAPLGSARRAGSAVAVATDVTSRHDVERLRDAFLGILGHELRTPVTSIVGAAELLRSDGLDPQVRRDVADTLVEEAHRVHRLVEQLIDLARLERSGVTSDEPIHVVHLARAVIRRERTRFPRLSLDLVADDHITPAMGAEGYVTQVLTILVDNAAKFSGKNGQVTVRVTAEADEVEVHVLDNGPGLPPAGRDAIFRLFQRGPASGPTDAPGLGIGLFVARAIVEAMGGRIWAEDRPGGGADVGFALPATTD